MNEGSGIINGNGGQEKIGSQINQSINQVHCILLKMKI